MRERERGRTGPAHKQAKPFCPLLFIDHNSQILLVRLSSNMIQLSPIILMLTVHLHARRSIRKKNRIRKICARSTFQSQAPGSSQTSWVAAASTSHFLEQSYGTRGRFPAYPAPCRWPFLAPRSRSPLILPLVLLEILG